MLNFPYFLKIFSCFNYSMMLFLPLLSLTSSDWVLSWFYMEIMLMFFYSLFFKMNQNIMSNYSSMKYFIIQGMASLFLLVSGMSIFYHSSNIFILSVFFSSLLIKLGMFPFHFWVISVMKNLNFVMMFLLLILMKIIPLSFLNLIFVEFSKFNLFLMLVILVSLMTLFVGSLMGNNFSSFNLMLGSSSINHSGWLMFSICSGMLWFYFIIYGIMLWFLLMSIFNLNNMTTFLSLLGLSGLPPFSIFFAKLKILSFMIFNKYFMLILILIILSVISLKFYLKFGFFYFLKLNVILLNFNWLCVTFLMINTLMMFIY
uniref:NADH-ubiquinone oxidoreductase chain 2 n=1 Tax=Succinea erythrophana TaxID=3003847 RepID=A0A9E9J0M4_9EUPU|nr:NADH dehydrogenase subunit 2 [Succinea erythrophana]WAO26030.1 NADH dehydrogenase subunit 2 [Succinea erythrophana]